MIAFGVSGQSALDALLSIFKGPFTTHLWYLYVVLGLTMFIPFLGKVYRSSTEIEKRVFIAIWFLVSSVVPVAVDLLGMTWSPVSVYGLESFTGFMGLFFLGAYLHDKKKERGYIWALFNALVFLFVAS